jgi:hypothetical protein
MKIVGTKGYVNEVKLLPNKYGKVPHVVYAKLREHKSTGKPFADHETGEVYVDVNTKEPLEKHKYITWSIRFQGEAYDEALACDGKYIEVTSGWAENYEKILENGQKVYPTVVYITGFSVIDEKDAVSDDAPIIEDEEAAQAGE